MSELLVQSYKDSNRVISSLEHDCAVLINTLNLWLYIYYLMYELLATLNTLFNFPELPMFKGMLQRIYGTNNEMIKMTSRIILFIGALEGLIGSANLKMRHLLVNCLSSIPFVAFDLFLYIKGSFHSIDAMDFLLFQTLLSSTVRTIRILATLLNLMMILQVAAFKEKDSLTFKDFL